MRWPRRRRDGHEAKAAIVEAEQQHAAASASTADVEAVALVARMLARRSDRFVREVEQSWRRPA